VRLADLSSNVEALCRTVSTGLHTLDFAGRRQLIELVVDRMLINHDEIEIRYAVPLTGWNLPGKTRLCDCLFKRTFAWLGRFRRVACDYERLPETLAGLHFLAFAIRMLKRLVLLMVQSA
jgi:hypothetical protein